MMFLEKYLSCCFVLVLAVLSAGCAKSTPNLTYKEVVMPVHCAVKVPQKPKNDGSFESHKALVIYYLECENLLKHCVGSKE